MKFALIVLPSPLTSTVATLAQLACARPGTTLLAVAATPMLLGITWLRMLLLLPLSSLLKKAVLESAMAAEASRPRIFPANGISDGELDRGTFELRPLVAPTQQSSVSIARQLNGYVHLTLTQFGSRPQKA